MSVERTVWVTSPRDTRKRPRSPHQADAEHGGAADQPGVPRASPPAHQARRACGYEHQADAGGDLARGKKRVLEGHAGRAHRGQSLNDNAGANGRGAGIQHLNARGVPQPGHRLAGAPTHRRQRLGGVHGDYGLASLVNKTLVRGKKLVRSGLLHHGVGPPDAHALERVVVGDVHAVEPTLLARIHMMGHECDPKPAELGWREVAPAVTDNPEALLAHGSVRHRAYFQKRLMVCSRSGPTATRETLTPERSSMSLM